jgi:hypothetical protein
MNREAAFAPSVARGNAQRGTLNVESRFSGDRAPELQASAASSVSVGPALCRRTGTQEGAPERRILRARLQFRLPAEQSTPVAGTADRAVIFVTKAQMEVIEPLPSDVVCFTPAYNPVKTLEGLKDDEFAAYTHGDMPQRKLMAAVSSHLDISTQVQLPFPA